MAVANDWNLVAIKAREAFRLLPTNPSTSGGKVIWKDIAIGHIDSGYTQHSVFAFANGKSEFLRTDLGVNYMEHSNDALDPLEYAGNPGHGTRTCSLICGNLPGNFVGVAPTVPTIPYRVINDVVIEERWARANIASAIDDAANKGCDVMSISLGVPMLNFIGARPMGRAVDDAYNNGIIVVCAGGQFVDRVAYPAKYFRTIGVGGVNPEGEMWPNDPPYTKSDREFIDVYAPADHVFRANVQRTGTGSPAYDYGFGDGTSYATAHVAAAAAMWLTYRTDALLAAYDLAKPSNRWMVVEAFRTLAKTTCQPITGPHKPKAGTGLLDALALLKADLPLKASLKQETREAEDQWG